MLPCSSRTLVSNVAPALYRAFSQRISSRYSGISNKFVDVWGLWCKPSSFLQEWRTGCKSSDLFLRAYPSLCCTALPCLSSLSSVLLSNLSNYRFKRLKGWTLTIAARGSSDMNWKAGWSLSSRVPLNRRWGSLQKGMGQILSLLVLLAG